jgi:hypothetical protein
MFDRRPQEAGEESPPWIRDHRFVPRHHSQISARLPRSSGWRGDVGAGNQRPRTTKSNKRTASFRGVGKNGQWLRPVRNMGLGRFANFCRLHEILAEHANWFRDFADAWTKIASWREEYNGERPHSGLGYRTPNEFAEMPRFSLLDEKIEAGHLRLLVLKFEVILPTRFRLRHHGHPKNQISHFFEKRCFSNEGPRLDFRRDCVVHLLDLRGDAPRL